MKLKNLLTISLLCVFFNATAQSELKVGDRAPDFVPFRWLTPQPPGFKSGKIYVVEFGATWCTPCAKAIPELSALTKKHPDVTVISTFVMELNDHKDDTQPAYVNRVKSYIDKKGTIVSYHVAVDAPDKRLELSWLRAAALNGIPAVFVIGQDGRIAAIDSEVSNINSVIERLKKGSNNEQSTTAYNAQSKFDPNKLLLINNNGGNESDFVFRSILTHYKGNIQAPSIPYIDSYCFGPGDSIYDHLKDRVQVIGTSIAHLYYLAYADTLVNDVYTRNPKLLYQDTILRPHRRSVYGKQWHLPVIEVTDRSPFYVDRSSIVNRFNYSLSVPKGSGTASFLQQCLRSDLKNYFGFSARVERRAMPVWNLVVRDSNKVKEKLVSKSTDAIELQDQNPNFVFLNAELRDIIWMLGIKYGFPPYDYGRMPVDQQTAFIDATGLAPTRINFTFNLDWSFQQFQDYLATVGLGIERSQRKMDVVVISDR